MGRMPRERVPRSIVVFLLAIAAGYVVLAGYCSWLAFPLYQDESHYWPMAQRFAREPIPSLALLRDYPQLSTPLVFMIWGWLEAALHGGVRAGRALDAAVSFGIVAAIALFARGEPARRMLACVGLLLFPYFLGVAVHLYPDTIASAFVLAGVMLHVRGRVWMSALAFALAISCRQFMVAFPAALALWEMARAIRGAGGSGPSSQSLLRSGVRGVSSPAFVAPAISCLALVGWMIFFGGFGPPSEIAKQSVSSANAWTIYPQYALYTLACLGAFYVVPERVLLLRRREPIVPAPAVAIGIAVACGVLFVVFPPLRNENYGIASFGYFDRAVRAATGNTDWVRMVIYAALATLCVWRFARPSLASCVVLVHAVLMMKVNVAWDKYQVPVLVVLWFLAADADRARSADHPPGGKRGI